VKEKGRIGNIMGKLTLKGLEYVHKEKLLACRGRVKNKIFRGEKFSFGTYGIYHTADKYYLLGTYCIHTRVLMIR
jgi:hypothetical protein